MNIPTVNIYIVTNNKGAVSKDGSYIARIEFVSSSGKVATKDIIEHLGKISSNQLILAAVLKSLECLTKTCQLKLYTDSQYFISTIKQGRLYKWERDKWLNAKGKEVINKDLWQKIYKLIVHQYLTTSSDKGKYEEELKEKLERGG